jgi:hypothetical protein
MWCTFYLCNAANGTPPPTALPEEVSPTSAELQEAEPVDPELLEEEFEKLEPIESCPTIRGLEDASADQLRQAITILNSTSRFTAPIPDRDKLEPVEQKLYDIFGMANYIQLYNPAHAAAKSIVTVMVEANPDITPECVLRTYLAQRGLETEPTEAPVPTPTPAPTPAPTPPAGGPTPAPGPTKPTKPAAPTPGKPAAPAPPLDLKPINDATGKLNGALARIRNAKQVKTGVEQRKELKKEADKLFKENNGRLKTVVQRINRVLAEPGFAGNPDKIAPFKRLAEVYETLEQEVSRL